mgnify:CR=1 FL=1
MIEEKGILELEGMEFYACHGCLEHEKAAENLFTVDFRAETYMRKAAESDRLEDAINYGKIYDTIAAEAAGKHSDLIEHLCGRIVNAIATEFPSLENFSVRISKKRPPVNGVAAWSRVTLTYSTGSKTQKNHNMNEKKKIAYITLGCKLNYAETSTYERGFNEAGLETVQWNNHNADLYLVNTCTVTEHSDKKCRNIIRKLHRISPEADIIVTGCYAQLKKAEIEKIEGVRMVFGATEKKNVVPSVLKMIGQNATEPEKTDFLPAYSSGERTRSFLKVQDGCDYFCAYCTVPYARGRSRNIPICELIKQAEDIASEGIKEIVLTGVNTGDFGKSTGESFFDLIKALNDVHGIERYRISSIEPNLLTEEMIDWIASGTKFLPHFHIPLQSGCDTILKEMGRRYDTAAFEHKIQYIRNKMEGPGKPKVFFGIDVIAGFPGETDDLFMETYNFLKDRIKPSFIHIFPYSRRRGTRAAEMKNQVQESIKTERVKSLEVLSEQLHADFVLAHKGMEEQVLFESSDKDGKMFGYTRNYIRVERPYDISSVGRICNIII